MVTVCCEGYTRQDSAITGYIYTCVAEQQNNLTVDSQLENVTVDSQLESATVASDEQDGKQAEPVSTNDTTISLAPLRDCSREERMLEEYVNTASNAYVWKLESSLSMIFELIII